MALTLYVGSKNYSSWSFRPWLAMRQAGIAFETVTIQLDTPTTAQEIARVSPSGRVPALRDGELVVWDSLAIIEYVAERFPEAAVWPAERAARAMARSVSAEMHSSFQPLREHMPMNMRAHRPGTGHTPEVLANVRRIVELWTDCRARFGAGGPFLFGAFSAADAMYAPVVSRFATYGVALEGIAAEYAASVRALPAYREWADAGRDEPIAAKHEP